MTTVILAITIIALAILGMAVGVVFRKDKSRGELKGSCGGPDVNPDCCKIKKKDSSCDLPIKKK